MKKLLLIFGLLFINATTIFAAPMPLDQVKNILELTKSSWVAYRDFNGSQLIYFTHLEGWKCGIKQVNYSFNSQDLDKIWELETCNPDSPNAILKSDLYITLPLDSVQIIYVQLTYDDDSQSEIVKFDKP